MRGAGFVTKRNSDRVLLYFHLLINLFIFCYLGFGGPRGTEARTVSHRLLYRKVALCFMFFLKNHETLTLLKVTCYI